MHPSSMDNMQRCVATYFDTSVAAMRATIEILDIGARNVNGSYSDLFDGIQHNYRGVDTEAHPGVDIVLDDPYKFPIPDNSIDLILCGQTLAKSEFFWLTFAEMMRVLKDDGFLFLIAPSNGAVQSDPSDSYRFFPNAYRALAKYTGCHLIDVWQDERGPWNDVVGVFCKTEYEKQDARSVTALKLAVEVNSFSAPPSQPEEYEVTSGETPYLETLKFLHYVLQPKNYLDIGVRNGKSLVLAKCPALGLDPVPSITVHLRKNMRLWRVASDDFFAIENDRILTEKIDFAFIDGMHLFEYAMRDFMHIERHAHPGTVVVIGGIYPGHPKQAERKRETTQWTGDVWKLYDILLNQRPDLTLIPLDTHPAGLLLVCGLDPKNRVLWDSYNPTVRLNTERKVPERILTRQGVVSPNSTEFKEVAQVLVTARENNVPLRSKADRIKKALEGGG